MLSQSECLQMMAGCNSPDLVEDDRKTNLIVNYLPQTMTQVKIHFTKFEKHRSGLESQYSNVPILLFL